MSSTYRCQAASLSGFVQQLAVSYLRHGYWFYVTGHVPAGKEPAAVDRKLIDRYGIDISKWSRARRKQAGLANMQYLRHNRFFVLLATHGKHEFFQQEQKAIRDARKVPVKYGGYSISYRGGHPHVRIEQQEYLRLKSQAQEMAMHHTVDTLASWLNEIRFERYAPIRRQLLNITRVVNRVREERRLSRLQLAALKLHRQSLMVFGAPHGQSAKSSRNSDPGERPHTSK